VKIRLIRGLFSRVLSGPVFSAARIPLYVWASLVSQILIVVTGGVVRLTGSGLGCPTWPKCTAESLVNTPEMGIHGIIEFANRLLTFVLAVIAILTFVTIVRLGKQLRKGLFVPALILGLGIPAQAVLGGFTVLFNLNPWFVGAHFVLSAFMISMASLLVWRAIVTEHTPVSPAIWQMTNPIAAVGVITVLVGVLVTGAGPHSGDAESPRNGLDLDVWQHFHSYPAYLMLLLVLVQCWLLIRRDGKVLGSYQARVVTLLLVVTILQAIIGVAQARLGVPPLLVGLHMLGASVLCSLLTFQWLVVRGKPRAQVL
jgi:cytochrome c oxidase assembly protein subunit 15